MGRLEGKVAIITGGNSGVGAVTAMLFAKEGAKVVISARRQAQLEEVAAQIRQAGGEVLPVVTDISKPEDAKNLVAKTVEAYGKVDVLVNNAGVLEEGL
ncbi:MAG: SDR family NAD(P)-dependent oxidoreductase, partial [Oscillospiraceae bacterium]|nr:SDR family NAD(P)-dependent oxidoreductase [Oscillospiraceae bacterium]